MAERVSEVRAKQGLRGLHVFWMLAISTVMAGVALVAAWAWQSGDLARVRGTSAAPPGAEKHFRQEAPGARQTAPNP